MNGRVPHFCPNIPQSSEEIMPYTGTDPDLIDLQDQITANLTAANRAIAGLQTQIKQVTLTLEGELKSYIAQFNALKAYVESNIPA